MFKSFGTEIDFQSISYSLKIKLIMKRTKLLSGLIVSLFMLISTGQIKANSTIELIKGNSHTILGEYNIVEREAEKLGNLTLRKFELIYENAENPVFIYLNERKKCSEYIVRSSVMEVMYKCSKNGFGAEEVKALFTKYPQEINRLFLSTDALNYQAKISSNEVSLETALGLIACYYPDLLKNINNL